MEYEQVTMKSVVKTLGYNAPELDTCHQSNKTDMYAYGEASWSTGAHVLLVNHINS